MTEFILPHILSLAALLALLAIMFFTPKTPFGWHRWLGYLALVVGGVACCALGARGSILLWAGAGRAAAEQYLALYVLGSATWLAWKASKPF